MDTSTNPSFYGIPGISSNNNKIVNQYEDGNKNHSNCTVLNDKIYDKLNIREQVFKPTNIPTMTLDEFAQKEMGRMKEQEAMSQQAKENAEKSDSEDEETADRKTYKAREWDDWKDLNDKGSGNVRK